MAEWLERLGQPDGAGDPARVHLEGRLAREAIEQARQQVAELAGVPPRRVVFTSGATEAVNTAVSAALTGARRKGLAAAVEHSAVRLATARHGEVIEIPVDESGLIDPAGVKEALGAGDIGLVNCQAANHEVGTVQPVGEIGELCQAAGVPLHVDAAAAFGHLDQFTSPAASFTSLSAHKMGGPPGIGALVLGQGVRLSPLLLGGSEERGRRAGAENLLGIVGFGAAAAELSAPGALAAEKAAAEALRERAVGAACALEGVTLLGPVRAEERLSHIACLSVEGVFGEAILLALDRAGVAAHSGSACSSEELEPSPVLAAMGADPESSLRISFGWSSTREDVAGFASSFEQAVGELRLLGRRAGD